MTNEPIGANRAAIPKAPKGLKTRGRQLWRELHTTYDFSDCPEKIIILEQAARTADVVERLQSIVDAADDLRVRGSQNQPVSLPEIAEARLYRALLVTQMRALGLPDDETQLPARLTRSEVGKCGAAARWDGVIR